MHVNQRLAGALAFLVVVSACSTGTSDSSAPSTSFEPAAQGGRRTSEGGDVTVVVDWSGPATGATFVIALDTHDVDLDPLDLATAVLRNDRGEALGALPWSAPKGGHHRKGSLTFEGDFGALTTGAEWIELELPGIGDIPVRTVRWELGP